MDGDICPVCKSMKTWTECWKCDGQGVSGHDCGEDTCVCLDPVDNVTCDVCGGEGGWWECSCTQGGSRCS